MVDRLDVYYNLLEELKDYSPRVIFVDENNKQVELGEDPAHAPAGSGLINPRHPD